MVAIGHPHGAFVTMTRPVFPALPERKTIRLHRYLRPRGRVELTRPLGRLRLNRWESAWVVLAAACVVSMVAWPSWEPVPFHVVWIAFALLYSFRVWSLGTAFSSGASCSRCR
jgi:hypothetical protein